MAKKVSAEEARNLLPTKYPWDEWLDGDFWILKQEEDFPQVKNTGSFGSTVRRAAEERGLVAEVSKVDSSTLLIKALTPAEVSG